MLCVCIAQLLAYLVLFCALCCMGSPTDGSSEPSVNPYALANILLAVMVGGNLLPMNAPNGRRSTQGSRSTTIRRVRRPVSSIMYELGSYSRRYYRMKDKSFWRLLRALWDKIDNPVTPRREDGRSYPQKSTPPNGPIHATSRLSIALRYFAGGDPLDISLVHGVSHSEVFRSVWLVVDAVNQTQAFDISFPTNHDEQMKIARDFQDASAAGFGNCAGAIDGILMWISKPSDIQCDAAQIGPKKFFCGRKSKFGLNMQAVCDKRGRFLDVSLQHPGSTSDYLAFVTSPLRYKLETPGFLAPGLALYGDNAYVNNAYMVTPFKNVASGSKDAYNFYQSQLRIRIECAFGMLVHRWAILRKAMPCNITLKKTTALIVCLCKLHNFCIDEDKVESPSSTAQDRAYVDVHGGIPLEETPNNPHRPGQLLGGGEHFDDVGRALRAQTERAAVNLSGGRLPRDMLLDIITENDYERVLPKGWSSI